MEENKEKFRKSQKLLMIVFAVLVLGLIIYFVFVRDDGDKDVSKYIMKNAAKHVTIGEYKGITYKETDTSVSDEEIQELIQRHIDSKTTYTLDESRKGTLLKDGDIVNCTYVVSDADGKEIKNGSANFELGTGDFKEFETALIGQTVGETISFTAQVPENYSGVPELATESGASLHFDVTTNYVCIRHLPEYDDEFAKEITDGGCESFAELGSYFKNKIETERQQKADADKKSEVVNKLIAGAEFKDINWMVKRHYDTVHATYEDMAEAAGLTYAEYVQKFYDSDEESFNQNLTETMTDLVKEQLVLQSVCDKEKLSVKKNSDEYKKYLASYMDEYDYTNKKDFLKDYGEDSVLQSMNYDKAIAFVIENAVPES